MTFVAVERLVVVGVDAQPLRPERMVRRRRAARRPRDRSTISRIFARTNSAACSFASRLDEQVGERARGSRAPPCCPALLELALALLGRRPRAPTVSFGVDGTPKARCAARACPAALAIRRALTSPATSGVERAVAAPGRCSSACAGTPSAAPACAAMIGIDWMPDEPVPMTPTRLPVKSTPSCGQRPVWYDAPAKRVEPGNSGDSRADRQPVAMTQNCADDCSPPIGARPSSGVGLVELAPRDARVELDVAAQVEAVGDVVRGSAGSRAASA